MALHKLKWVSRFEKSAERNIEIDPNAGPECHLESRGLIPGLFARNGIKKLSEIAKNDPKTEIPKNL